MLFNYHVKEMYFFFLNSVLFFFQNKQTKKTGGEGRGEEKRLWDRSVKITPLSHKLALKHTVQL